MSDVKVKPATPERWADLEKLFGPRGACGGCWCMFWRLPRSQFHQQSGESNRQALQQIVQGGEIPGLLAYQESEPVGWVCLGPRERFPALERSKLLARIDDQPVWSVVCFYITKVKRCRGIAKELLTAAVDFARQQGAKILEGYPSPAKYGKLPDSFVYTGLESLFLQAGFELAARRGKSERGIFRYYMSA